MPRYIIHQQLFDQHARDLQGLFPNIEQKFVCPICLNILGNESIKQERVNLGHVWPEYIRKGTTKAVHQQVLLCTDCNSKAGESADASMQTFEKLRNEKEIGNISTPLRTQIISTRRPDRKPIKTGLFIKNEGENRITIKLEEARTEKQRVNNIMINERIRQYNQDGPISIIVESSVNLRLARVGWLTSAYLLAFYTFGYRYIFQRGLDPVRDIIRKSFDKIVDETLEFDHRKFLTVGRWDDILQPEPRIGIMLPIDRSLQSYMSVDFQSVHIRMPAQYRYDIVWEEASQIEDSEDNEDNVQSFFVDGSGHLPHNDECHWEDGFGKIDYTIGGEEMIRCK